MELFRAQLSSLISQWYQLESEEERAEAIRMIEDATRQLSLSRTLRQNATRTVTREAEFLILERFGTNTGWPGENSMGALEEDLFGEEPMAGGDYRDLISAMYDNLEQVESAGTPQLVMGAMTESAIAVEQVDEAIAIESIDKAIVALSRRRYSCEHCTKRFGKRRRLYSHRKCHYPDRMVCVLCGAVLRDTDRYSRHLTRRHGRQSSSIENEPMIPVRNIAFKCSSCDFVGNNRKHFWRHKKRFDHVAERIASPVDQRGKTPVDQRGKTPVDQRRKALLKCPDCDYSTGHRQNLDRHSKRRHSTVMKFSCEYCGKAFKDMDTVRVHIRYVHENDRRYGCSMCDRRFVTSTDLHRHQRLMHYKLRLFGCERCGKRFQTLSHKERHFLIVKDCHQSSLSL